MTARVLRCSSALVALALGATLAGAQSSAVPRRDGPPTATSAKPAPKQPKRFDFNGSLGFSQTSGNANALTTNLSNRLKYTMAGWNIQQDLAFYYGEASEKVNTNFWNGGVRGERTVAERVALFLASRYERNVVQGVSSRFQQGFGVTVRALDSERNRLNIALGGSFFSQQLTPGSVAKVSRAFPAARAAMDYRLRITEVAYVQQSAEYLPAIGDTATSFFVNTESSVVAPISKNVGIKIGYVVRYNSEPPVRNDLLLRTTDTFFSSGLTLTF